MAEKNHHYQIISVILLIAVITFAGLYFTKSVPDCPEVNENLCSEFITNCPEVNENLCSEFITNCPEVNENLCSDYIVECPEPEQKALMFGVLNSWGENYYDSSEYLLGVDVYNFGEVEAKNVELICDIYVADEDGYTVSEVPVTTVTKRIGNVASTSYKYAELEAEKSSQKEGPYPVAICSVKYCENCEILDDKIEELQ
jgi:hypothetical protein